MADLIQLLPDSIANQIAAGEVVQRPSSVVKELLENSIDSGADEISLVVKDSGKTLIQVIDNGSGMSETDARMAFERHATSKIKDAQDLFNIKTMGFRGEALASISAISQVQMITKLDNQEMGTSITVEASNVVKHELCQSHDGTTISVKNLFYNIPARRKFLKSDPVELKHINDEFQRIALANPHIFFSMHHNGNEIFHLPKGNLRQRIVSIFGKSYNEKIVPIKEDTESIIINGFVGKPESSKKTRGEQYLFVNNRFIKSNYLNHAIRSSYQELISQEQHPFYVLFMEINPGKIDVNVHPTKQEIKFEDERLVYNYLKVSVRHALGIYNVTPTIDFHSEFNLDKKQLEKLSFERIGFDQETLQKENRKSWELLYEGVKNEATENLIRVETKSSKVDGLIEEHSQPKTIQPYQIHSSYILIQIKSGFLLIDQQAAHERIFYEKYLERLDQQGFPSQKQLFPESLNLNQSKAETLKAIRDKINRMGFDVEEFGDETFVIHGIPVGLENIESGRVLIEQLLEQYENNLEFQLGINENLARSLAVSTSLKKGVSLEIEEMNMLIDQLFACDVPNKSPSGNKTFVGMDIDDIKKRFKD